MKNRPSKRRAVKRCPTCGGIHLGKIKCPLLARKRNAGLTDPVRGPSVPKTGDAAKSGYRSPKKVWNDICPTCRGQKETYWNGTWSPCARCQE